MKKIISISIILIVFFLIWYILSPKGKFDTKPYEIKIDSLKVQIDSINKENESLEVYIGTISEDNKFLVNKIGSLNEKIGDLKSDLKDAKSA